MQKIPSIKTKSGFTLIELLVVVSIIALLVSILLPALSKARQQTYRVRCLTNLKQIGVTFTMYAHDWKDQYPPQTWAFVPANKNYFTMWRLPLLPYLQNVDSIFYCPVGSKYKIPGALSPLGVNSYRMRPKIGSSTHSWKAREISLPATFMILQDTAPVHGTKEHPKNYHPQLFADVHADLGVWINLFNESAWN